MTPLDFARNLARSDSLKDRALGVGIVARGLADDDPATLRQGWPIEAAIPAAIEYLRLDATDELIAEAERIAPTISDAILNRH